MTDYRDRCEAPQNHAERWFMEQTWQRPPWSSDELSRAKAGRTVTVALPALNEERTVGPIVQAIRPLTVGAGSLVDEIFVVDSGSDDATLAAARAAGARAAKAEDVLPHIAAVRGKGEALWRAVAATRGDILVFIDADLEEFDAGTIVALLGPMMTRNGTVLSKGFYDRLRSFDDLTSGGRVTELLARPLISAVRPELCYVIQPLGGAFAATRDFLTSISFRVDYGVDLGILLDAHERHGLAGLAQVNLGRCVHRNRALPELGVMARQIVTALSSRSGMPDSGAPLVQFVADGTAWSARATGVDRVERPPLAALT